jgi:hypothetical protein
MEEYIIRLVWINRKKRENERNVVINDVPKIFMMIYNNRNFIVHLRIFGTRGTRKWSNKEHYKATNLKIVSLLVQQISM